MLNLQNMRAWEVVEKVIRRHWIAFLPHLLYIIILIIFIISFYVFSWGYIPLNIVHLIIIPILMISILGIFISWMNSELDMYVITNKRIIWIDQVAFLDRGISECSLKDVQEVNSKTKWILWNIFNYWSLTIQTASSTSEFHMSIVPDPQQCARLVLNIVDNNKKKPTLEA